MLYYHDVALGFSFNFHVVCPMTLHQPIFRTVTKPEDRCMAESSSEATSGLVPFLIDIVTMALFLFGELTTW